MEIGVMALLPDQAGILADAVPELQSAMLHPLRSALAHADVVVKCAADRSGETSFDAVAIRPHPAFLQRRSQPDPEDVGLSAMNFAEDVFVQLAFDGSHRRGPRSHNFQIGMLRLEGLGGAFGLFVSAAHDVNRVASFLGALVHRDQKIGTADAAGYGCSENAAGPDQGNAVGHGKVGFVQRAAILCVPARLDYVVDVDEYGIAAVAALNRLFDSVQSLIERPAADADTENVCPIFGLRQGGSTAC